MAFDIVTKAPTLIENVGINHSVQMFTGVATLAGGTATVTIPGVEKVICVVASSQTSNAARYSATSGSGFTITGTGTDAVGWIATCIAKI